jgi:AbrB family looped-hinge helix DNA binding protein
MAFLKARTRIDAGGRIVIPRDIREALEVREGDAVLLEVDDQGLHIRSVRHAVQRAQQLVARYVKPGRSLSAELIAERRRDAKRSGNATRRQPSCASRQRT